jgi:dihydrofolate synthase/folylpolyglutamate synthase
MNLKEFLSTKELYYEDIDYEFFPKVWEKLSSNFSIPKVIHIIGTNGKGSTGRFLAYYLFKEGFKVGHYSSPHILRFNERIWIDGNDVDDATLEKAHKNLMPKIPRDILKKLSYFEYTTLLAIEIFQNFDYIVLEAGLGGEFDATNVFEKIFTLVTPIGIDHESFLGNSLEEIAKTKLNSVSTFAIMTKQDEIVYKVADRLNISYFDSQKFFSKDELKRVWEFIQKNSFASYLKENLTLALSAVKKLDLNYNLSRMEGVILRGRFQRIANNVIIDVGHNQKAAIAIKKELGNRKITLIYNTYKDKDFKAILSTLKLNIKKVLIIEVKGKRVVDKELLKTTLEKLDIPYEEFNAKKLKKNEDHLVFGSFVVVEEFLKFYQDL